MTDGSGNVVSDYVYGGSSIIARLDANGDPLYYLTDSMGSVIGLVDGDGNIQSRIVYDGFGNVESGDDGSSLGGDFRFQGQWLESESGLYYMRARDYDAGTGLFLSRDAVDMQQQGVEAFNPYQFAYNNPLVFSDPSGMFSITELNAAQSINDQLQSQALRYVSTQAQDYVKQRLGDAFGKVVLNAFNAFFPGATLFNTVLKQVDDFGNAITGVICSYFEGLPLKDNLFIEVRIDGGVPQNNGLNCSKFTAQSTINPKFVNKKSLPGSQPDFLFRNSSPMSYKPKDSGAYLIGDFKLYLGAARKDILAGDKQWENMAEYAKKYQILPFVSYLALFNSNPFRQSNPEDMGLSKSDEARLAKAAFDKGVILVLAKLNEK